MKKRYWMPAAAVVGIIALSAVAGKDDSTTAAAPAPAVAPAAAPAAGDPAPAPAPAAKDTPVPDTGAQPPIQSGDWRLDTIRVDQASDMIDWFTGSARVTYTGDDDTGAANSFTVTVFAGGKPVASMSGHASDVAPGDTVTVDLFTTDDYVPGPYTFDFQNDW